MKSTMLPFNVEIMRLDPERLKNIRPVTSLDYYERAGGDLHEDGLFSIAIFGRVGDEQRDKRFSYIDLRCQIFHPFLYMTLVRLRAMYKGILSGETYAKWNESLGDFEPADELTGRTGFQFFVEHWPKIRFTRNKSDIRDMRIALIEKYRDRALVDRVLVLPAGLRDVEVTDDGRTKEGDINPLYRRILSISRAIPATDQRTSTLYDRPRYLLQLEFNKLYELFEKMLTGKGGFVQNRWGSRRIFNGTRNVITAMDTSTVELGSDNGPHYTDTVVGLYQLSKAALPKAVHALRNGYLNYVFSPGNGLANVVDPQTLESVQVKLSTETFDRWYTAEGLEKVISSLGETSLRIRPVMLDRYYAALIYVGPDRTFRVFHSISELPEGYDRKHVRPINLLELVYLSGYQMWNTLAGFVTRYPIIGTRSTYASTIYVKTTVSGEARRELGPDWAPLGEEYVAKEFPVYEPLAYLDSLVIPSGRLAGLDGDFDGDVCSLNVVVTDEAIAEVHKYLDTANAFVDPRGRLHASADIHTVALVLRNMTG